MNDRNLLVMEDEFQSSLWQSDSHHTRTIQQSNIPANEHGISQRQYQRLGNQITFCNAEYIAPITVNTIFFLLLHDQSYPQYSQLTHSLPVSAEFAMSVVCSRGRFESAHGLLNLGALKISLLYKNRIFHCMGKIHCVRFQRYPQGLDFFTRVLYFMKSQTLLGCIWWSLRSENDPIVLVYEKFSG